MTTRAERERQQVEDRLRCAEFGGWPVTYRPITPPARWSQLVKRDIPRDVLRIAADNWESECSRGNRARGKV